MERQKYIFVDTQIWIYCCLSSQKGEDKKILQTLKRKLDNNEIILILPETVAIEFQRRAKAEIEYFIQVLEKQEKEFSLSLYPTYEGRIKKHINNIKDEVQNDFKDAKVEVDGIFQHKNTVKTQITATILVEAHKRSLKGLKPYSHSHQGKTILASGVQSDCLILEEIRNYLKDKTDYILYFCSNNTKDFADVTDNSKIHTDIKQDFLKVEFYSKLFKLINFLFKTDIKETKLPNVFREAYEGYLQNVQNTTTSITSSMVQPLITASEALAGTITNLQSAAQGSQSALASAMSDATVAYNTLNQLIPNFTCTKCGKSITGFPFLNSLCQECFLKPFETAGTKP